MPPKERQAIDLSTLDAQQLSSIREQLEEEVQSFVRSSVALQKAAGEFGSSGRAIESLSEQKEGKKFTLDSSSSYPLLTSSKPRTDCMFLCHSGQPLLLPLTSSLYVAGTLASTDNVLVDIGTGYYMEVRSKTLYLTQYYKSSSSEATIPEHFQKEINYLMCCGYAEINGRRD